MNQDRSNGQVKAFKFAVYAFIFCIVFAAAVGFFAGLPRRLNEQAAQKLYRNTALTQSSEAPVIKRPYTVYGRKSTNTWTYKGGISGTKLITDAGITESVKKARTCVLVWADTSQMKKSEKYVWGNGQRKDRDAYFCPVYMTVIEREDGVRYDDSYRFVQHMDVEGVEAIVCVNDMMALGVINALAGGIDLGNLF